MEKDIHLVAKFISAELTLTVNVDPPNGGNATGADQYDCGDFAEINATENHCFVFVG